MKIGLISDTHGYLDERVFHYFSGCDEVWHAGDVGDMKIITALEAFKPLRAVYGNIDDKEIRAKLPEDLHFNCGGVSVFMTHIAGAPPRYNPRIIQELKKSIPQMLICGHSHILKVKRDEGKEGMLYINPGAAGQHGFHTMRTLIRFTVEEGQVANMEVIELGKRGAIPKL